MITSDLGYLMALPKFDYFEPGSADEVCSLLNEYQDSSRLLAGGTDILNLMKKREITPKYIINLKKITNLNYIDYDDKENTLLIGPTTTLSDIENSGLVKVKAPLVAQAVSKIGSPSIRNIATLAGNICNALPSADSAPALICLGAKIKIQGAKGVDERYERTIGIEDFFTGPRETAIANGEFLKEIQIPSLASNAKCVYIKFSQRTAMDLAIVGVAVILDSENGTCNNVRIALGAVAPTPLRAIESERVLMEKELTNTTIDGAAKTAAEEASPISDHRASAEYRRDMIETLVRTALNQLNS